MALIAAMWCTVVSAMADMRRQPFQGFVEQRGDCFARLARKRFEQAFLCRRQIKGCRFHTKTVSRKPQDCKRWKDRHSGLPTCKRFCFRCVAKVVQPFPLSLSRLNHWLPGCETHPEVMQGTAEFHHQIADALLPQTNPVFHDATALHTAVHVLDAQPTLVQCLVGSVLLPRQLLATGFLRRHEDLHL